MFKLDSPFMNFLNKVCDIMILNFLVLICSLPIVTFGAAITAGYYISYKMVKNEEGYIVRGFFKAFKENFKQSTIIWLIMLLVGILLYGDYKIVTDSGIEFNSWMIIGLFTVTVILGMGATFIFPMQARFSNTVKNTIKNGFLMALSHLPSALLCLVSLAIPLVCLYLVPQIGPVVLLLAGGLLIYFKSMLFLRIFKKYEEAIMARQQEEEDETVQDDENGDSGIFAGSEAMEKMSENK